MENNKKQSELDLEAKLAKIAAEKEEVRKKLVITAEELAKTAVEKEEVRRKLAITAKELAVTAEELAKTAAELAKTATEKEEVRIKLAITAAELAKYTTGLEVKGVEQTAELLERVKQLETINKSMVGRELKMVELKKENEELKKKI